MLLAIDAGNTSITIGVFDEDVLNSSFHINTHKTSTASTLSENFLKSLNEYGVDPALIDASIISSVVSELTNTLKETVKITFNTVPIEVTNLSNTKMPILYNFPEEIGSDRIVNAVAAFSMFGSSVIVVDLGTATTFDCVSANGEYLGGAIAPGIKISSDALTLHTSKLPEVDIKKPMRAIGKNTVECMQSGIFYGYVAMVDGLISRLIKSMHADPVVISTGGFSKLISDESEMIRYTDEYLTLKGLQILFKLNG